MPVPVNGNLLVRVGGVGHGDLGGGAGDDHGGLRVIAARQQPRGRVQGPRGRRRAPHVARVVRRRRRRRRGMQRCGCAGGGGVVEEPLDGGGAVGEDAAVRVRARLRLGTYL